ncbi:DUF6415 family natural product biosynthesis protein [Streptomyces sp. NPDC057253]|uniref:DUF6415 family natural product biosynthesis protein n=1 Tax=Streptomyces sp. NPDC057253 TaxID=3346069 RepID=UPI00362F69CD
MAAVALSLHPNPAAIPQWSPPMEPHQLGSMLSKMAHWKPLDLDAIYEDLDQVLGEQQPAAGILDAVSDRLRDALERLSVIAEADPVFRPSPETAAIIARGRLLRDESVGVYRQALGLARRRAFATSDLIDHLVAEKQIKDDNAA